MKPLVLALVLGFIHGSSTLTTLSSEELNVSFEDSVFVDLGRQDEMEKVTPTSRSGFRLELGTPPQTIWLSPSLILSEIIVRNTSHCFTTVAGSGMPEAEPDYGLGIACEWYSDGLF